MKTENNNKLKSIAHHLKPVLIVNEISDNIVNALNEFLDNHELIKIQINHEKEIREEITQKLQIRTKSKIVQQIGKRVVFIRKNKNVKAKLSNLSRFNYI